MSIYKGTTLVAGLPDVTGKANVALDNLSDAGSIVAAKASMPSTTHDVLSWPATGTDVTAPSDGWFFARRSSDGSNTGITLLNQTTGVIAEAQHAGGTPSVFVPAAKGDTVTLYWVNGASSNSFWFVYAKGSESEAS